MTATLPHTRTIRVHATPFAYTPEGAPLYLEAGTTAEPAPAFQRSPPAKRARLNRAPSAHAAHAAHAPAMHIPGAHAAAPYAGAAHAAGAAGHSPASASAAYPVEPRRTRLVWTAALHARFEAAVRALGVETAAPKQIMARMGVPSLTRENVASHLQKYRAALRRRHALPASPLAVISAVPAAPAQTRARTHAKRSASSREASPLAVIPAPERRPTPALPPLRAQPAPQRLPPIRLAPLRGAGF